jgi:hypothetical protein
LASKFSPSPGQQDNLLPSQFEIFHSLRRPGENLFPKESGK